MMLKNGILRSAEMGKLALRIPHLGGGNILHSILQVDREGDSPWLTIDDQWTDADGIKRSEFSLKQLDRLAQAWSVWYVERGVQPRDRVAIYLDDSFKYLVHLLALSQIGAIAVFLNGRLSVDDALVLCARTDPVGLYTDECRMRQLKNSLQDIPGLRWTRTVEDDHSLEPRSLSTSARYRHADEDPVLICHSSGTTGAPKAVIWTHRQSIAGALYRLSTSCEQPNSVMLLAAPHSHSGAVGFTFYALLSHIPLIVLSDPDAQAVSAAIKRYRPTTVVAFSTTYADLATNTFIEPTEWHSVNNWINMGDAAHHVHVMALIRRSREGQEGPPSSDVKVIDGLGSSELGWAVLRRTFTRDTVPDARFIGEPAPFAEVAVLRADGTAADPYEIGMLGVKSSTLTPGYWNDSDTNYRSRLRGYWFSGDVVYRDKENRYYHVDRVSDVIQTRDGAAYSVSMEETLLLRLSEISDCAVVASRKEGEVVPIAVAKCQYPVDDPEDLLRRANAALRDSNQVELAAIVIARLEADFPVGPTGKALKRIMREQLRGVLEGSAGTMTTTHAKHT